MSAELQRESRKPQASAERRRGKEMRLEPLTAKQAKFQMAAVPCWANTATQLEALQTSDSEGGLEHRGVE